MSDGSLQFMKLKEQPTLHQPVVVTHCLTVQESLRWQVSVHGHIVRSNCTLHSTIPETLTKKAIQTLLTTLDTAAVCAGHPDKYLLEFAKSKKGALHSKKGEIVAEVDKSAAVSLNGNTYIETIRLSSCHLLVHGCRSKCCACIAYRNTLRAAYNQWQRKKECLKVDLS